MGGLRPGPQQLELLEMFVVQAAVAVEHARLHAKVVADGDRARRQLGARLQTTMQSVVDVARDLVPAEHAAITTVRHGRFRTVAATDGLPPQIDQLQYDVGQGPCVDAIRQEPLYRTDDLAREQRWPVFGPAAAAKFSIHSMMSLRLFAEHAPSKR